MKQPSNASIREELTERFLGGEKISLDELVKTYYQPGTHYAYILAEQKLRGILSQVKHDLQDKHEVVLAPLGAKTFGIPTTSDEYTYAQNLYVSRIKGLVNNAIQLHSFGRQRGLLPSGMRTEQFKLPLFTKKK